VPLPKVPNGQKISLILPAELVRRIKLEALDSGCLPTAVVQKALEGYWGIEGTGSPSVQPRPDTQALDTTLSLRGDNYPCASVTTTPGRLG